MSYIVPREKPEKCMNCPFIDKITYDCKLMYGNDYPDFKTQYENCPLIEIPVPHGRLIDEDKIDFRNDAIHDGTGNLVIADNFINGILWLNDCIERTPTIIEAEGNINE